MAAYALTIALAGNPNVGKSTLFNALTGSHQHVGNWPGKTVEKKEGSLRVGGDEIVVVDLPGTYSLTAYSIEEIISRDFILLEQPGAVVVVVDAANLERNLYLVTQLMELDIPLVLALNMIDMARKRGMRIDVRLLSARLGGIPVVEVVGNSGIGIESLKEAIRTIVRRSDPGTVRIPYDDAVEAELPLLQTAIESAGFPRPRWTAIKLLEGDLQVTETIAQRGGGALVEAAQAAMTRIEAATGEDAETLLTDGRYQFIMGLVDGVLTRSIVGHSPSERLDHILTHRLLGLPIFLLMMWVVFQLTANVSAPLVDWMDGLVNGIFGRWLTSLLSVAGLSGTWFESLIVGGVLAGVGGVLVFVPVLMVLYFAIGVLEDSGYMARAAFVMDRAMRVVGLHGKSFLPMLVGFGCNVPAVYATRTLEHETDRKVTGFLVTFMSCGARLPVYVVVGSAIFGAAAGNLIFGMYILGILVALATAFVLKRGVYRNQPPQPFVMELPPYRAPRLRDIWRQMSTRTGSFVREAGTIILATSVVIWLLLALPVDGQSSFDDVAPEQSAFGAVSRAMSPIFAPAGFASWQTSGALVSGLVAKEVVVSTMNQIMVGESMQAEAEAAEPVEATTLGDDLSEIGTSLVETVVLTVQETINIVPRTLNIVPGLNVPEVSLLNTGDEEDTTALEASLVRLLTPLSAVAFTAFVLLYTPCMTTVAAMRQEFGTRWAFYQVVYTLVVAWGVAVLIFQGGRLLGLGG